MAPTENATDSRGASRPKADLAGYSVLHKTGLRIGWNEGAAGV